MSRLPARAKTLTFAAVLSFLAPAAFSHELGSRQTREFVQAAAQSDQFEIMEATTVLAQSQNPDVRGFARSMIDAHRQTSMVLIQAVAAAGLNPPSPGLSNDQSQFLAALQSLRGAKLDQVYVKQQVLAHNAALAVEKEYAETGDAAAVRAVASSTIPIIAAHLKMVEQMQGTSGS